MKKTFFIAALAMAALSANAQLEVDSLGRVILASEVQDVENKVYIGCSQTNRFSTGGVGLYSKVKKEEFSTTTAIVGDANDPSFGNYDNRTGVLGIVGGSNGGRAYGVWGQVLGGVGCGIYGSVPSLNPSYSIISGTYAGRFDGPVYVNGSLRANSVLTSSDLNLKENITPLTESNETSALSNVLAMNVVKYNYKTFDKDDSEESGKPTEEFAAFLKEERERQHFGLIAQELQTIYPNLVVKGQDGYLSANYIELVPVLIQSIQDLKKELDEIKGYSEKGAKGMVAGLDNIDAANASKLYQNTPNPFKESTTIRFQLADNVKAASICIFDMQGKMLKKYEVGTHDELLAINASELGEGMFLYTLIADGREIDTKRMILTK